jgi:hypothetical protein
MNAIFQTSDTDLATYLYSQAYRLLNVWCIGDRTIFVFPKEAEASADAFFQGACVPAKNLLHACRQIQSIGRNTIDVCRSS